MQEKREFFSKLIMLSFVNKFSNLLKFFENNAVYIIKITEKGN